jgi:hypothetical protein
VNHERSESQRRLLNDLLREDDGAKQAALAAFRRARFVRRVGRVSALVVLAGVAVSIGILFSRHNVGTNVRTMAGNGPSTNVGRADDSKKQPEVPTLTDEQLLASFPPNSCFLAEIDGRQVLVFMDPAVEEQVLHRGSLDQTRETH